MLRAPMNQNGFEDLALFLRLTSLLCQLVHATVV